jgi:hypothetical protein
MVTAAEFTGKYAIAQNLYSELSSYITKYQDMYLINLLGAALYRLFKADQELPSEERNPIYQALIDPILEDYEGKIMRSEGIKEMLKGFIYFEYCREQKYKNTPSGTVVNSAEISKESSDSYIYGRYNEAIDSYRVIQWYITENKADYPTFNGVSKGFASWL